MSKRFILDPSSFPKKRQITTDGKFQLELERDNNKALLIFSPKAWIKMFALVDEFKTEVQWHGLVRRIDEATFTIEDILCFPHTVAAATVTSDEEEYFKWIESLPEDELANLRFHGHSHVHMNVSPSAIDTTYRLNKLGEFGTPFEGDDFFYIFLITNKRREYNIQIFDITNNSLYDMDKNEIVLSVLCDDDEDLTTFLKEAKKLAVEKKITYAPSVPKVQHFQQQKKAYDAPAMYAPKKKNDNPFENEQTIDEYYDSIYGGGQF